MNHDQEDDQEIELNQALLEFLRRYDAGAVEDRSEFLKNYPELAEKLSELLDTADWIETMAGPKFPIEAATPPEEPLDPNAMTLPAPGSISRIVSPDESTLPPSKGFSREFQYSLSSLPHADNTQAALPCRFGDYILHKILGRGGMGVVYLATQCNLDRQVAVKMIRSGALATKDEVDRFYAEARSAGSLDHPSIITVHHCGEIDGHHYFSMDYVPGTDLAKRMSEGPMSVREAVRFALDVARAIEYAHSQGVVHRDLKPANVLIDEEVKIVLTDFGLAKRMGANEGLTATGATLGTPSYMSPEQASGNQDDQSPQTDVYAIGAILFALLTGKPPFQAESIMQTLMQVMHKTAPSVRSIRRDVHPDLDTIVTKCLEKLPSRRYASAKALADDLEAFYRGAPIAARPPSFPRRAKHWIQNIPILAALTGIRNPEPSPSQKWTQNGIIVGVCMIAIGWLIGPITLRYVKDNSLPDSIVIASGVPGGMYFETGGELSTRLQASTNRQPNVITTGGSVENLRKLEEGNAHLAIIQESALRSNQVAVVAPLFYEAIHVLVRRPTGIESMQDIKDRRVILGARNSGTRQTASRLFSHFDVSEDDVEIIEGDWFQREVRDKADVVIVVIKPGLNAIADMLEKEDFKLLPIPRASEVAREEHIFLPFELGDEHYKTLGRNGIQTLATTALLATRKDASARLVTETLKSIYDSKDTPSDYISVRKAASWQNLPYHDAARLYFSSHER